jgi:GAF domain-containing protein
MNQVTINPLAEKSEKYSALLPQIQALIEKEPDLTANLANICAALKATFNWWWIGFYIVKDNQLVLGPFQGPVACTRIDFGKGVCGTAWQQHKTIIVPNVHLFPGHIACSALSNSEIVVPIIKNNAVMAVLDIDSEQFNTFDETDKLYLEKLVQTINF